MQESKVILWMILICTFILLLIIFAKPLKKILKMIRNGAIGLLVIWLLNFVTATFQLQIGINLLNGAIIGILGIPGLILLYLLKLIL
ncbi:MAG: SigmaK-factor processing regulatory BofA [Epulopiscium sp.]|nr:SigmaK-factor processing regulatory BofA [Candidatus Epulonipiscium sp.]